MPRLLDLFCGEGGAGYGYYLAGFEVVGVDLMPQKHYPFEFHQADAMKFSLDDFDAIHASPPCQDYSVTHTRNPHLTYPRLLEAMRERLMASRTPWILENVVGAPMWHGVKLCGSMFGLPIQRHRLFDSSHLLYAPGPCRHRGLCLDITGEKVRHWRARNAKGFRTESVHLGVDTGRAAMGMPWATLHGICEAIPPVYTEWLGRQLMHAIEAKHEVVYG